jgi:Cof subfamily protein (haloacid dehalogenase superfamily)
MSKKVIFFDVDGTLIDYSRGMKDILDSTKEAIASIKSQGNLAVLATGRPKSFLTDEIYKLNFDGYITSNGAYIELKGKEIYNREIDRNTLKNIIDTFEKEGIEFIFEGQKLSYFSSFSSLYMKRLLNGFAIPKKYITDEWRLEEVSTNKFVAILDTEHKIIKAKEVFGDKFAFMKHPGEVSYDVYFKDCTKADGINRLVKYLNIPMDNTYAFGDGINDIEMLQTVKYGIAMGNANERLKKVADLVTNDVSSHGIYNALKQLQVI